MLSCLHVLWSLKVKVISPIMSELEDWNLTWNVWCPYMHIWHVLTSNEAILLILLHPYLFYVKLKVNVKWRSVVCLNSRRIKYVYIAGTKGVCHAAYDWCWLALQAARWAELRRIQHEGLKARPFYVSQQKPRRLSCPMAPAQSLVLCLACISGTLTSMTLHSICAFILNI